MILRPYQLEAKRRIFEEWKEVDSTLLVLPTGTGKTVIFADIIREIQPKRALVLAHRKELIIQARNVIRKVTGLEASIEMGDHWASADMFNTAPVIISTVQTQIKRMHRWNPEDFGAVILDEAHHATSEGNQRILSHFTQNKQLKVLGVTATPDRADEESLGKIFKSVAYDYEILDAINDGWLVPINQQFIKVKDLDFSGCRTTAGDFNAGDLAKIVEDEKMLQGMIGASVDIIGDRRAIVFTVSVRHAEMAAAIFNRRKKDMAKWICGTTPDDERSRTLQEFSSGTTQIICNCGVLLEGFDDAGVEVIVMARPTKSRSLYAQMIGRSTRPLPNLIDGLASAEERKAAIASSAKPGCLVLDFVGNSGRHKLCTSADILGGKVSEAILERAVKNVSENGEQNIAVAINEAAKQLLAEELERKRIEEEKKSKLIAKVKYVSTEVNPFVVWEITPEKERGWHVGRELSKKQKDILTNAGIKHEGLPFGQGKQLVDQVLYRREAGLATLQQAEKLKAMGLSTNMSWQEAAKVTKIPACTSKQAYRLRENGYDPFNYTVKTASELIGKILCGQKPEALSQPPPAPKLNGEPATLQQQKFLQSRHYNPNLFTKKEATRLFLRIKQNGFRHLPPTDPDHWSNWKPGHTQPETEPEPELVVEELPF